MPTWPHELHNRLLPLWFCLGGVWFVVCFVCFGGFSLAFWLQPVSQLHLNSNKVTCAEPAHIAPRLVQKSTQQDLWTSPTVQKHGLQVDITPTAAGLQGMHEYRIAFPAWSQAAVFCPAHLQHNDFEQLANSSSNAVHMGCQVGKAY